jgi:glycosyltransferase involved in cell wall biosynthesis
MVATPVERPAHPKVTIVVPAWNEARNLEIVLPGLPKVHEVIVVDGHSTDGTAEVVARVLPEAKFLQQTRRGKGNALAVGFEAATGDVIVMFDADGSADASEISDFVAALVAGADFAKGSRVLAAGGSDDITLVRDTGNRMLTLFTNVLFRTKYTDLCYGYNAFWRDVLQHLAIPSSRYDTAQWGDGFEIETLINCRVAAADLQIHEVPSVELRRIHGESNLHAVRDGLRVLRTILTERFQRGRSTTPTPSADLLTHAHADADHALANEQAQDAGDLASPLARIIDLRPTDRHPSVPQQGTEPGRYELRPTEQDARENA